MNLKKNFFKLRNNEVFGKTVENVRKHRNIKLIATERRRNYLVSEPSYNVTKWFSEGLLAIEIKIIKVKMKKPVYLGLSILEIDKTLMREIWYGYIKPKYQQNAKLYYMDTDCFITHIKTEDVYENIANDVENRFDISNYELNRILLTGKNKKVIGLMKDEFGGKTMAEFVALKPKTYSYLMDDGNNDKLIMHILKKLTRLHWVVMMIKDCKLLIKLHHIHMMQVLEKYAKQS